MQKIAKLLALALGFSLTTLLFGTPDLVPMPKYYKGTADKFYIDGKNIYIQKDSAQCRIASEELEKRMEELGGKPGRTENIDGISKPGIYILTVKDKSAETFKKKYNLKISDSDPGPQGYVIHFSDDQLVIIGSDNIGALYGAMTLCQMLENDAKSVFAASAEVRDWPDFKYRSCISFIRGISQLAFGEKSEKETMAAYKAGADIMLHFKMNMIFDYNFSRTNLWDYTPEKKKLVSEFNKYAVERGIIPVRYDTTAIQNMLKDKLSEPYESWKCVKESRHGKMSFYCWSNNKDQREKIEKTADLYRECNFKMVCIHPVDGGAIEDPESWSKRCAECKKLWKDNERWKATIHQLNMWAEIFKKRAPEVILESPVYPYSAAYANRERFPNVSKAKWKQNSIDFWEKTNNGLDPSVLTGSWMSARGAMDKYRTCWKDRPMAFCGHYPIDAGIFSTYYRYIISDYYGIPGDIFWARGTQVYGSWLTLINCVEFAWNTLAPGNEEFKGLFYDPEKDHTSPKVIIDKWLPRACRNFYGKKVGNIIAKMYQSGVQPYYITEPGAALARANKSRRKPLADVDPNKVSKNSDSGRIAPDIIDNAARMASQVKAAKISIGALDEAWKHYNSMNKYQKKLFIYFYKRMPQLYAIARARYASRVAADLQKDGMFDAAAAVLENGLKNYKLDSQKALEVKNKIKGQKDILPDNRLKFGKMPKLSKFKKMLETRLSDAKVILKPRRPGKIIQIGIYKGSGAKGAMEFFSQFKNANTEIINSLNLSVLDKYDCVFIMKSRNINKHDFFHSVKRYVEEGGGGVVIEHDLIGGERGLFGQKTPFPEICKYGSKRKDGRKVRVAAEHPALKLKKGEEIGIMYVDWIVPVPGDNGSVIVEDSLDEAVVVAGEAGYGKVIFSGTISVSSVGGTYDAEEKRLYGLNAALAKGAVEWFTGVKLEKK